jgi:hypothetical protein
MNDQAPEQSADPTEALLDALDDSPQQESEEQTEEVQAQADEPEAEEGEEAKPEVTQKFRVKVENSPDGDPEKDVYEELTIEEMASGYLRERAFTQKTQALAAERKQAQEQFYQAVNQTAEQAQRQIAALHQMVVTTAAPELQNVNWQQLASEDPARYVQLQAKQQQLNQVLGTLQHQHQQLEQQRQAAIAQQRDQAMKQSLDYLSREIPGFNLEREAKNLREAGKRYGFSEEELGSVIDGRFVHLLHDAAKWRELQTQKPKALQKVAEAPKVLKPQAPQPKKQNASALDRLKKTGRAEELMNFL